MTSPPILTFLIILPLAASLCMLPLLRCEVAAKRLAMATAVLELIVSCMAFSYYGGHATGSPAGFFLYENYAWIRSLGIRFTLGMDGISLLMTVMTTVLTVIAMLASWRTVSERVTLHFILLLVLESAILGVFLALDLFLFYLFWEVMLIPMFFLIGIWGHGRKIYSAIKFFIFTLAGSLLMLLAVIGIYLIHGQETGVYSFGLAALLGTHIDPGVGLWLYGAFLLGFAIKFPLVPVHTWLPDAHTDAPTAGSIDLAGLLLKTGAYGLIRFGYPLFPQAARTFTPVLVAMAIAGILYTAWIAFAQRDMKRLVAYSSVGHMGFVALGIAAWTPLALSGSVVLMVCHGVTTSALFALVGMLSARTHTREIDAYGGLWDKMPVFSCFFLLFAMASAGLPGLNNFIGEFLILIGSYQVAPTATVLAFLGLILSLVYTVRLVQRVLFQKERRPLDLFAIRPHEYLLLAVLGLAVLFIGLHPGPLLTMLATPVHILTTGGTL